MPNIVHDSGTRNTISTTAEFDFSHCAAVPDNVMMREIGGEAVIVNLHSESYFGLDDVGTRMWVLLTESSSIQIAFDSLKKEYEVDEDQLRSDLSHLLHQLVDNRLLILKNAIRV